MKKINIFRLVLVSLFVAIILVMNSTPIGYIQTGFFTITLMTIPVALGAVCLGPVGGAFLGAMFGLTSFLQAFGIGFVVDPSAATLFTENPFYYAVMCFVPRIVAGLIAALVFKAFEKATKTNILAFVLSAAAVPILNTTLYLAAYLSFYSETVLGGAAWTTILTTSLLINFTVEFTVTLISGAAINKAIYSHLKKLKQ